MRGISIVMTTYFPEEVRFEAAKKALQSWDENLSYALENLNLIICDDGSPNSIELDLVDFALSEGWSSVESTRQERKGVGASLNQGFKIAFDREDLVLYLVDDWELISEFNLYPWAHWIEEDETVGMIRIGPPHPNLTGKIEHSQNRWCIRLDRHHFAFGHRPALYHPRMSYYGQFAENVNAYDCERLYSEKFNSMPSGPDIVYALPYPWAHVESVELAGIVP